MNSETSCVEFREIISQGVIFKFFIFSINTGVTGGFFEFKIFVDTVKRK